MYYHAEGGESVHIEKINLLLACVVDPALFLLLAAYNVFALLHGVPWVSSYVMSVWEVMSIVWLLYITLVFALLLIVNLQSSWRNIALIETYQYMNVAVLLTVFVPILCVNSVYAPTFYDAWLYRVVGTLLVVSRASLYLYAGIEKSPSVAELLWRKLSLNSLSYSEADRRMLDSTGRHVVDCLNKDNFRWVQYAFAVLYEFFFVIAGTVSYTYNAGTDPIASPLLHTEMTVVCVYYLFTVVLFASFMMYVHMRHEYPSEVHDYQFLFFLFQILALNVLFEGLYCIQGVLQRDSGAYALVQPLIIVYADTLAVKYALRVTASRLFKMPLSVRDAQKRVRLLATVSPQTETAHAHLKLRRHRYMLVERRGIFPILVVLNGFAGTFAFAAPQSQFEYLTQKFWQTAFWATVLGAVAANCKVMGSASNMPLITTGHETADQMTIYDHWKYLFVQNLLKMGRRVLLFLDFVVACGITARALSPPSGENTSDVWVASAFLYAQAVVWGTHYAYYKYQKQGVREGRHLTESPPASLSFNSDVSFDGNSL